MTAGSRVTWFSDGDCWGTVVALDGEQVIVRWDSGTEAAANRSQVRLRRNVVDA